jgi:hypothetical protein
MYTHGGGFRTYPILAAVSLSIACASHGASRPQPAAVVDLNAPTSSRIGANASPDERALSRGEIAPATTTRYATMQELLAARVPALDVRSLGAGRFTLRVRGRGAPANAEPVVVIDGMRYLRNGADMLGSLTPREVKRIELLQDAASIADVVGAGTSGVIVVTTWRH